MKNKIRKKIIILIIVAVLSGGMVFIFTHSVYYQSVQDSKQLVGAIQVDDVQKATDIVKQNPKSVNALPSTSPWWWQLISESPEVFYPLQEACSWENYDMVKLLIENGADVNLSYKGIESAAPPLILAIQTQIKKPWMNENPPSRETTIDIIRLLIEHGADKSIKDSHGKTAYDYVVENGFSNLVELLRP